MPVSSDPCPKCGTVGAQVIRNGPTSTDYFCESCLHEFIGPLHIPPRRINSLSCNVTIH